MIFSMKVAVKKVKKTWVSGGINQVHHHKAKRKIKKKKKDFGVFFIFVEHGHIRHV